MDRYTRKTRGYIHSVCVHKQCTLPISDEILTTLQKSFFIFSESYREGERQRERGEGREGDRRRDGEIE